MLLILMYLISTYKELPGVDNLSYKGTSLVHTLVGKYTCTIWGTSLVHTLVGEVCILVLSEVLV